MCIRDSNEHNAKMGLVCATPTAGSAGCLPAVLTAAIQKLDLSHEEQLDFLFAAGAFGLVIANNASISGAEGCLLYTSLSFFICTRINCPL